MRFACICTDCGKDTTPGTDFARYDWYVVRDSVWAAAGMANGFLCTPCLEARLGRKLEDADYLLRTVSLTPDGNLDLWFSPDYPLWRDAAYPKSTRSRNGTV